MRTIQFIVECVFWAVVGVITLGVLAFGFAIGLAPVFGGFAPFLALFIMIVVARAVSRGRRRRGQLVMLYVEQALRLNLPLPQALDAAARSERGTTSRRLSQLEMSLSGGSGVGEAIDRCVTEVPWRTASLLIVAERLGRLPRVAGQIVARQRRAVRDESLDPLSAVAYGMVVALFLSLVLGFVSVFILPKFQEIFEDFDTVMPAATLWTLSVMPRLTFILNPLALLGVLTLAGWTAWTIYSGRVSSGPAPMAGLTDRLIWVTPVWGGVVRDRGLAEATRMAAEAVGALCPLDEAFARAATAATNTILQNRLLRLAERMQRGSTIGQAAREARLPSLYRDMLATLDTGGEPAGVLRFLASYYESRLSRAALFLRAAAVPGVVIVLAVIVGFVVYSLFLPLVVLIESQSPYWSAV